MIQDNYVKLGEISKEYFDITPGTASRKAAHGLLPVPAIRLSGTRQGPLFVLRSDLEKLVKTKYSEADKLHRQMA